MDVFSSLRGRTSRFPANSDLWQLCVKPHGHIWRMISHDIAMKASRSTLMVWSLVFPSCLKKVSPWMVGFKTSEARASIKAWSVSRCLPACANSFLRVKLK